MAHQHPHDHGHDHQHGTVVPSSANALRLAFFINLSFTVVELVGGLWTDSIAVLTDAFHDAGDCLVLGAAWYLQHVALKGRDAHYSYGYGRFSMLGGWLTSLVLIAGALFMLTFSIPRIWSPEMPDTVGMFGIAVFGLLMNGIAAWKLHGGASLNERGAYLHLLEDVLGWAAVLVGAVVIHLTGWVVIDPLLSIGISLFILVNAIGTLRKGTGILMQQTPANIDPDAIRSRLLKIPFVNDLHDQHTWTLDGRFVVHTVHLVVETTDLAQALSIKSKAREELLAEGVHHATIELEMPDEHCSLKDH